MSDFTPRGVPPLASLVNREFIQTTRYKDQQSRAVWTLDGVDTDPVLKAWARAFVRVLAYHNVPLFVQCAMRTATEQVELRNAGRSKTLNSPHMHGAAVDIVHGTRGWNLSSDEWNNLGEIGHALAQDRGLNLNWGGTWSFYDPAHWEIRSWRTTHATNPTVAVQTATDPTEHESLPAGTAHQQPVGQVEEPRAGGGVGDKMRALLALMRAQRTPPT